MGDLKNSEVGLKLTERANNLGCPRFLIQVKIGHMCSARRALMQGEDHFDRALVRQVSSVFKKYVVNGKSPVVPPRAPLVQPLTWSPKKCQGLCVGENPPWVPATLTLLCILFFCALSLGLLFY